MRLLSHILISLFLFLQIDGPHSSLLLQFRGRLPLSLLVRLPCFLVQHHLDYPCRNLLLRRTHPFLFHFLPILLVHLSHQHPLTPHPLTPHPLTPPRLLCPVGRFVAGAKGRGLKPFGGGEGEEKLESWRVGRGLDGVSEEPLPK
ncbi:uncharacterized protein K444DRAFT_156183 [Hyaloscypha bicolor E]|uniref:Secreted protein n=1 Tax=Hyaloscypha bicolor E TaxID=1095630 RepID=A0A2J6TSA3_9HELO|nr:uncharacterized protein K444DRAFT_156183 [Hyaloscypha bicolor E]PMD65897.1 hypothetical protein K444DRAFT_156183 [Hyaloscypha bicolor E]